MSFLQWSFSTPTEIVPVGLFILHTELKTLIQLSFSRRKKDAMVEEARLIRVEIEDVDKRRKRSSQPAQAWLV